MIRIGPARNAQAGGIAVLLSCVGCGLLAFGFFLTVTGIALTASSNDPNFQSEFFESSNNGKRTAGIVLLVLGLSLVCGGIICCVCMTRKAKQSIEAQKNQPQTTMVGGGQPLVTGSVPVGPVGYQPQGTPYAAQYQPPPAQYPPSNQYPPPGAAYPPAGSYPMGQQPPTNPTYNPGGYPPDSTPASAPPAYSDVMEKQ